MALYGLLLIIPPMLYSALTYKKTFSLLMKSAKNKRTKEYKNMRKRIFARVVLRAAAWCMVTFAMAGISWGTVSTPAQKNGGHSAEKRRELKQYRTKLVQADCHKSLKPLISGF